MSPPEVLLHDTRTGEIRRLEPSNPPKVRIYACGPTVYGEPHIGHGRFNLVWDVIRRLVADMVAAKGWVASITAAIRWSLR